MANKFFIGLGVAAALAGILLAVLGNVVAGISGAITGLFLIYLNVKTQQN